MAYYFHRKKKQRRSCYKNPRAVSMEMLNSSHPEEQHSDA